MDNDLPFETVDVDGVTLFVGELVVVNKMLEADDTRAEEVVLVNGAGFFPLCRRFDNVALVVATGLPLPAKFEMRKKKKERVSNSKPNIISR